MRGKAIVRAISLLVLVSYPSTSFALLSLPADWQYPAQATQESPADSTTSTTTTSDADCLKSQITGKADASAQHSSVGYFLGGVCSGVLLGLIGTAILTVAAAGSNPDPSSVPDTLDVRCYVDGYHSKAKSKNVWSALGGGLLGTTVFLIVYLSND